jgi:tetrahydromethanopterin S-methyltransferase subunit F
MNRSDQSDDGDSVVETIRERRPTVAPADLLLIALPALLLAGWAAGVLSALSLSVALAIGTLPALAMLGYALFCDPPGETYAN